MLADSMPAEAFYQPERDSSWVSPMVVPGPHVYSNQCITNRISAEGASPAKPDQPYPSTS